MKKYKVYYTLTKEYCGCPIGTQIRVHDWSDTHVQISIKGTLEYIFEAFGVPNENLRKLLNIKD